MRLGCLFICRIFFILEVFVCCLLFSGCERNDGQSSQLIGIWRLYNRYGTVAQISNVKTGDQEIEEYTSNDENITYDCNFIEIGRRSYRANGNELIIFGSGLDGKSLKFKFDFWVRNDTLMIESDSGYGPLIEYYYRIRASH